ncbi:hypothetical protein L0Z31_09305 [Burkholderia vietnamiensis]|uniref:hypothetical protein n=1 Tax=Burkholderia cepacia complex TaxID=87882 RepID=UPI00075346FD|nr:MULTISPECIES: hypothetical protein [Burkholderia cepacia complex]KVS12754.1 hypothetical protein WK32_32710 [Burkholderia vietnamiensis]MBU9658350.1 hypothetical protein [Burkholderia cenocepacia]MCO1351650.1 hypothetical protein [Burkholderia vietnamiensis]MCO1430158.1 hypothetical protein [Burkholderia vietnamiensis]UQN50939.1 hypothetical protein L0Y95_29310 [Burkholderia vietnamiensis]
MGFFELTDAAAMLRKARRELARLAREPSIDHVFNFFVTAYHVTDYLKGEIAEADRHALRQEPDLLLCADVANKAKHMKLEFKRPDPATDHNSGAIGGAAINAVAINDDGERWVSWPDGTRLEMVAFGKNILQRLERFLADHGLAT